MRKSFNEATRGVKMHLGTWKGKVNFFGSTVGRL